MTVCDSPTPGDDLLASMDEKLQIVRDRVQGVAEGYSNGLYLWGEGGTSKSHTIEETLKRLRKPFKVTNTQVTGKGLFVLLEAHPDAVHVIEDCEQMFADPKTAGVLRSALWGQAGADGRQERTVVWQTAAERREFVFTGGVIIAANRPLDNVPQLRALKTRIPCVQYQPTDEEAAALMRHIAKRGYRLGELVLTPTACLEVADAIVERSARLTRRLDLRLLVNTFNDRLQYENGAAETHWLDLLDSRMRERVVSSPPAVGRRASRKWTEHELVRRIADLPAPERLAVWVRETGKSQAALYRRLKEPEADSQFLTSQQGGGSEN